MEWDNYLYIFRIFTNTVEQNPELSCTSHLAYLKHILIPGKPTVNFSTNTHIMQKQNKTLTIRLNYSLN